MKQVITFEEALSQAAKYCAVQERCRSKVEIWLRSKKLDQKSIQLILNKLEEEGFINEERYARSYVRGKFRMKGWGRVKIITDLKLYRISTENISTGLTEIDEEEYIDMLEKLLQKKSGTIPDGTDDYDRRVKLVHFGYSKGYEMEHVYKTVDKILKAK